MHPAPVCVSGPAGDVDPVRRNRPGAGPSSTARRNQGKQRGRLRRNGRDALPRVDCTTVRLRVVMSEGLRSRVLMHRTGSRARGLESTQLIALTSGGALKGERLGFERVVTPPPGTGADDRRPRAGTAERVRLTASNSLDLLTHLAWASRNLASPCGTPPACCRSTGAAEATPSRRYSTVTVFARFRGWSTFRQRSRAMR